MSGETSAEAPPGAVSAPDACCSPGIFGDWSREHLFSQYPAVSAPGGNPEFYDVWCHRGRVIDGRDDGSLLDARFVLWRIPMVVFGYLFVRDGLSCGHCSVAAGSGKGC